LVLASYRGIPYAVVILLVIAGIFTIITTRTPFGRHVYAIGGNMEAARLSGVNVRSTVMRICMLMGIMSAVSAIVFTARLNAATTAAGNLFELDTIAACMIGGASSSGGIGTIFGAIIGALVMASLDNGMSLMNLPIMIQYMVKGMILLLAVWIDIANRKK
jgi:D-xylose transport system permease protein